MPKKLKVKKTIKDQPIIFFIELARLQSDFGIHLIRQLDANQINKKTANALQFYFIGLLYRQATLLDDISFLLEKNHPRNRTSTYILFRSLTDDFLSANKIFAVKNIELELAKNRASGYDSMVKALQYGLMFNKKYFNEKAEGLPDTAYLKKMLRELKANQTNKDMFIDDRYTFLDNEPSTSFFKLKMNEVAIPEEYEKSKRSNASAFWIYKFLSNIVHFSPWTFEFEERYEQNNPVLADLFLFSFKTLGMCTIALFSKNEKLMSELIMKLKEIESYHRRMGVKGL